MPKTWDGHFDIWERLDPDVLAHVVGLPWQETEAGLRVLAPDAPPTCPLGAALRRIERTGGHEIIDPRYEATPCSEQVLARLFLAREIDGDDAEAVRDEARDFANWADNDLPDDDEPAPPVTAEALRAQLGLILAEKLEKEATRG